MAVKTEREMYAAEPLIPILPTLSIPKSFYNKENRTVTFINDHILCRSYVY